MAPSLRLSSVRMYIWTYEGMKTMACNSISDGRWLWPCGDLCCVNSVHVIQNVFIDRTTWLCSFEHESHSLKINLNRNADFDFTCDMLRVHFCFFFFWPLKMRMRMSTRITSHKSPIKLLPFLLNKFQHTFQFQIHSSNQIKTLISIFPFLLPVVSGVGSRMAIVAEEINFLWFLCIWVFAHKSICANDHRVGTVDHWRWYRWIVIAADVWINA